MNPKDTQAVRGEQQAAKNTDREIWRGKSRAEFGDEDRFYADSLHIPQSDVEALGINCGGYVIVKPIREWHALARVQAEPAPHQCVSDGKYDILDGPRCVICDKPMAEPAGKLTRQEWPSAEKWCVQAEWPGMEPHRVPPNVRVVSKDTMFRFADDYLEDYLRVAQALNSRGAGAGQGERELLTEANTPCVHCKNGSIRSRLGWHYWDDGSRSRCYDEPAARAADAGEVRRLALEEARNAQCWMCREGQAVELEGGRFVHPNPYGDNFGKEGVQESAWKWCDASEIRALAASASPAEKEPK